MSDFQWKFSDVLHVECTNKGKALKSKKGNRNQGRCNLLTRKDSCHTKCDRVVVKLINYIQRHIQRICFLINVLFSNQTNSTRKKQFRDVLQEMYSKRNLERSKKTVRRTASSSHVEVSLVAACYCQIIQNIHITVSDSMVSVSHVRIIIFI